MKLFKKTLAVFITCCLSVGFLYAQSGTTWKMQPVGIQTRWAKDVSPENVHPEYPRPQMVRTQWENLNGLWQYTITEKDATMPSQYEGQILVPFPLESALSGVKKSLLPSQLLWYKRTLTRPDTKGNKHVLLNFGAVDWQSTVFINGKEVGGHTGGYQSFSIDITDALKDGDNELVVRVYDPTDEGSNPHGKQVLNPQNIYYTPSSGIWQTVWLETVPAVSIAGLKMTPDIDKGVMNITVNAPAGSSVELVASEAGKEVSKIKGKAGVNIALPVKNAKLWSPDNPFLYDLSVKIMKGGKVVDEVASYFGMRKIAIQKDEKGQERIFLNNKYTYNLGNLDQGFWPEGLMTAPTDEALKFDIEASKAMGFNTIRKHIKIEPARWYYHADKIGMLIWQDMVNAPHGMPEGAKAEFEKESKENLEQLHNYPSITTWVLFNEQWGSYDQKRMTEWVKSTDPSRIVNGHSGEYIFINGQESKTGKENWVSSDMTDVHSYPDPMISPAQAGKARVLGEFGGIGVSIPGHQWTALKGWGYIQVLPSQLQGKYAIMNQHLKLLEAEGLSGSIYTEPFDVEGEENGLITYDREVIKIPFEELRKIHAPLVHNIGTIPVVTAKIADMSDPGMKYSGLFQEYMNGKREPAFLHALAEMSIFVSDKPGGAMVGNDYIATLKAPLTEEQIRFIAQFTKSTTDPGFALMNANQTDFRKVLGDRQLTVSLMNMIFNGEINPLMQGNNNVDWKAIETKVAGYGTPGDEIYLRAKAIYYYNKQDWAAYAPVATNYLSKYGSNISEQERNMFQGAVDRAKP
ncbi:Beta-galactosidase/beta-glucuronidase [Chitinophaga sp. YR573]|uniref:glycoside hydrolase family 2 protein n=1 Tax=Chitinophaga sp. YR573 TaxID=1881040 RepID=UPI0008BF1F4E|nr:sugar-binding domain-containing protein [Chitinophaga sp. YR573]SEW03825.1 Beta-galactosidase/beta-glucuronidase [Chitinophaga sp. YR573]